MTITLELSPDEEARLREKAAAHGQSLPDYLKNVAERDAAPDAETDGGDELPSALAEAVAEMTPRTPEQIAELQARAIRQYLPRRTPPPGKTVADMIGGRWPGDETDEQVRAALQDQS